MVSFLDRYEMYDVRVAAMSDVPEHMSEHVCKDRAKWDDLA
jgi:hypothetical protein